MKNAGSDYERLIPSDSLEVHDGGLVQSHRDLRVYQLGFELAGRVFELTKSFPVEERFSLTDQIRRSSRSVTANIAEAWRKRRYPAAFVSKLSDAEAEAAETQCWLEHAASCKYGPREVTEELRCGYERIIGALVQMQCKSVEWTRSVNPRSRG